MNQIEHMADELATEVISEAAQTFFGQRKDLDEELDRFTAKSRQLGELGARVILTQSVLNGVLLDFQNLQSFHDALGLPLPEHRDPAPPEEIARYVSIPTAWTLRGKYEKLLHSAYTRIQTEVDAYLHGGYRDDPANPKRKIAYGGYQKLASWAETLNQTIAKLNTEQSPGEVLQFVKGLDERTCAMEKASGASCNVGRDRGLLYACVDFSSLRLPVFPEYPPATAVQQDIREFSAKVCAEREADVRELLRMLQQAGG